MTEGERRLRWALALVALAGLGVSGYLSAVRLSGDEPVCAIAGGCSEVQKSAYSEVAGVPVAFLGLAAYAGLLLFALVGGELGRIGGLFTALVGVGFSAWLTWVEVGVIDAICVWCVASACLMVIALILAVGRLRRAPPPDVP